jgi:hypothetical protein
MNLVLVILLMAVAGGCNGVLIAKANSTPLAWCLGLAILFSAYAAGICVGAQ